MIQVPDRFTPDEVAELSARERYVDCSVAYWDGGPNYDAEEDCDDDLRDSERDW